MENLKQKIQTDLTQALKKNDEVSRSTLRMLLAAIVNKEKEKRYKEKLKKDAGLTDQEVIEVVVSEVKKRKEAIVLYEKGNSQELADKEKKEIEILEKYLPEQLSEEEIKRLIKEAVEKVGAKEIKDMGKVMAEIMPKVKGQADGTFVSKIVKELLS